VSVQGVLPAENGLTTSHILFLNAQVSDRPSSANGNEIMRKADNKLARLLTFLLLGYLLLTAGEVFAFIFVW
jgi:hypothetical protein